MGTELDDVLNQIAEDHRQDIQSDSRFYREVNIGRRAAMMGCDGVRRRYDDANAIVPLKRPAVGMTVRIDGRTFTNYAQFESGVVVPLYIAEETGLRYRSFVPNDSMILNFV